MQIELRWKSSLRSNPDSQQEHAVESSPAELDDLAIVARAQVDPREFGPLYEHYAPIIYHYCLRRLSDPEAAADTTALVFTRALGSLPRFRPDPRREGSTFRAWLFTIAHNVVVDHHRRSRPHRSLDAAPLSAPDARHLVATTPSPEEMAIHSDDAAQVQTLLATLPERPRAIVELRLAGLSGPEIAQSLGMTTAAVKSAQRRAYASLRDLVRQIDPDAYDPEYLP